MDSYNNLRWERVKKSLLHFDNIKMIVKSLWEYELREDNIEEFLNNIGKYKDIDEGVLLCNIEPHTYRKLIVYDMKDIAKYDVHPIISNLDTMNKLYFISKNKINIKPQQHYKGKLDSTYRVTYYDDSTSGVFEMYMASVKKYPIRNISDDGEHDEYYEEAYDSIRIIINFDTKKVFLFYNNIDISREHDKDIKHRKVDFCNLFFGEVKNSNLIKYNFSDILTKYVLDYIEETKNNENKRLVNTIEINGIKIRNSTIKTSEPDFNHSLKTLEGIEEKLLTNMYRVCTLECKLSNTLIKVKYDGEISLFDSTFQSEVVENVYKEVFEGSNIFKGVRGRI